MTYSGFPLDSQIKVIDCPSSGHDVEGIILTEGISGKKMLH